MRVCQRARGHAAEHMILTGFQVVNGENTQGEVWKYGRYARHKLHINVLIKLGTIWRAR